MKVVLVCLSDLPTLQNGMYLIYDYLRDKGDKIFTIGSQDITSGYLASGDNYTFLVPESPRPSFNSITLLAKQIGSIVKQIIALQPDVIHFTSKHLWNVFIILSLKLKTKAKIIHTFHDPIGHDGDEQQRGVRYYYRVMTKLVDAIVVHSKKCYVETKQILRAKCNVVRVPLGSSKWRGYCAPSQIHNKLLFFGRINNYKGVEYIPLVADEMKTRMPQVKLVVAGKAAQDFPEATLDALRRRNNVELINEFIPEAQLDSFFDESDVVIITHTSITQSGVITDAYTHSKPVVAFRIEGIEEFIANDELCVSDFDINEYCEQLVKLLSDFDYLKSESKLAWEFGTQRFTDKVMANMLEEVYRGLIS